MSRRPDVTLLLAIALPVITVAALLLVRPDAGAPVGERPPTESPLQTATLVCPGGGEALLSTTSGESGKVRAQRTGTGDDPRPVRLATGEVTGEAPARRPLVVNARGKLAPGLVGSVARDPLSAVGCREPLADQWFTGVGAGARHSTVVDLVNPDAGPAVVDITVLGRNGVVDAPALRGITVSARGMVSVDVSKEVPRRDELALNVVTTRGRVAASARDRYDLLGAGASADDWLATQEAPSLDNHLLGLPPGGGQRMLTVANPGDSQARATMQLITEKSTFTPEGAEDIAVPPGGTAQVLLSDLLTRRDFADAIGIRVTSAQELTASVRSFVDGDLSQAVGGTQVEASTALVPRGDKRLLLAGAEQPGRVVVTARNRAGKELTKERTDVAPDQGAVVRLPADAALVDVRARNTAVVGAVEVTRGGDAAVVPLTPLLTTGLLADVRPGVR